MNGKKRVIISIKRTVYGFALSLALLLYSPLFLYQLLVKGKYRKSFWQRLGFFLSTIEKREAATPTIWVHAVSVGEVRAIAPLVKKIREQLSDCCLIFSTITETGQEEAKRAVAYADYHFYLPLDLRWIIRPIVTSFSPHLVLLCESDLWFNFLTVAKEVGAKVVLANGKISERSYRRYRKVPYFFRALFGLCDDIAVQNDNYGAMMKALGIERCHVVGNMKFDSYVPYHSNEELDAFKKRLGIAPGAFVITLGSTHAPEEALLLKAIRSVKSLKPIQTIVVPRHPERFAEVQQLLSREGIAHTTFSEGLHNSGSYPEAILIDAMGQLLSCYQISHLAIVGGSYTPKVGGHNLIEPCHYGIPVFFGPHTFSQPDMAAAVATFECGGCVAIEELAATLSRIVDDAQTRTTMGQKGRQLLNHSRGATDRTWQLLERHLPEQD